ncbi:FMN-dependent NADH-azoreductase [Marinivivus vitaminiproducens]|uniref:FMN-dependent NADH-azoreductase n=1 Tax=Marinivivus vitaminiproducens TaxID=3035935 RepID=UPI0027AAD220|nr:NAD(P)H-dependent oxidoreductase [Geminicoccaceae bacterium SCSIO 64248]
MTTLLHLDASARPGLSDRQPRGSHTRRLTARFVEGWRRQRPLDHIVARDLGREPPTPVTGPWIEAAFTKPDRRDAGMNRVLAESDRLVSELVAADVIVAGVPMYNFNVPAPFKAYIDNVVRVGRTFGFDRGRAGEPYWPLLANAGKTLVVLTSRGDFGYDAGGRIAHRNHVEASIRTAFAYIGITDLRSIAVEYDEFADERLRSSLAEADRAIDDLLDRLLDERRTCAGPHAVMTPA